jgi:hypothetical protein
MPTKFLFYEPPLSHLTLEDTTPDPEQKPVELTDDEIKYIERVTAEYTRMQEWLATKDKQ